MIVRHIDSLDSLRLAVDGLYERFETGLVRRLLGPGQTFLDVGAHIGYYSALAAPIVGPEGRVIAVEPEPRNLELLGRNLAEFPWARIVPAAALDRDGMTGLWICRENTGDHRTSPVGGRERLEVPAVRVDSLGLPPVDVFKVDVQGAEIEALRGMEATLAASPRCWGIVEYWPAGLKGRGHKPEELWRALTSMGLRVYVPEHKRRLMVASWPFLMKVKTHLNLVVSREVML